MEGYIDEINASARLKGARLLQVTQVRAETAELDPTARDSKHDDPLRFIHDGAPKDHDHEPDANQIKWMNPVDTTLIS